MTSYTHHSRREYISRLADSGIEAAARRLSADAEPQEGILPFRSGSVSHWLPGWTPATGWVCYLCDWYHDVTAAKLAKSGAVSVTPSPGPDFGKIV